MLNTGLNPLDFPASVYAHELSRDAADLRFEAPLETEYRIFHLRRVRLRVGIWFTVTIVLAALFTIDAVRRLGLWHVLPLAHLCVLMPCTAALVWLPRSRHYERIYLPVAGVLVTLFIALIAIFIANGLSEGRSEQLAALAVNLMGVFFFAGLMFRQAIVVSAIALLTFVVAGFAVGLPQAMLLKSMIVLTSTSLIGAIVYRDVEKAYRRNFLETALIGELIARDGLSGLMNRRAFDEHLLRVWQHALRDQRSIAVLMIDIDHFKQYNDALGHQAGDVALRSVAQVVQSFARRPLDLAARYGGEEFAVILYDLALPYVQDMAERLRQAVQGLQMAGAEITVSVGVGVAAPTIGRTPQGAVQLADEALYEAKQAGRNRVVIKGSEAYRLLNTGAFKAPQQSRRLQ
jgi:diguanylate cyclase (GGDEF)-like protein